MKCPFGIINLDKFSLVLHSKHNVWKTSGLFIHFQLCVKLSINVWTNCALYRHFQLCV